MKRIAFVWWCHMDRSLEYWRDGLWAALQILKQEYEIRHFRYPDAPDFVDEIMAFKPDLLLCWGAFSEPFWDRLPELPYPKALCFAGGDPKHPSRELFDLVFVESAEWEGILRSDGIRVRRAFGTNTKLFRPEKQPKVWDGIYPATFAKWKRHELFARALKERGLAVGRIQPGIEPETHEVCRDNGTMVMDWVHPETLRSLYNASRFTVITANEWGGCQRIALESMACNVPVIATDDSKASRFVWESGFGIVAAPDVIPIQTAMRTIPSPFPRQQGREWVLENWSERHYADALRAGIKELLS